MVDTQRCNCSRPIPVPVPVERDTRDYVVESDLVGEQVMYERTYWDPQWSPNWSDLWRRSTRHYEGQVRGIIDTARGPKLLVHLTDGALDYVSLETVVLRKD